jgi:hypothetical protein
MVEVLYETQLEVKFYIDYADKLPSHKLCGR